jgi:hypothetical protein
MMIDPGPGGTPSQLWVVDLSKLGSGVQLADLLGLALAVSEPDKQGTLVYTIKFLKHLQRAGANQGLKNLLWASLLKNGNMALGPEEEEHHRQQNRVTLTSQLGSFRYTT